MKKAKKIAKMLKSLVLFCYYKVYCCIYNIKNNDIWLISERGFDARDNSYHLFKYIRKKHPNIKIKYIIEKNSPDYDKVSKLGETVQYGSKEHYILFITAKVLISTHDMGYSPEMSLFTRMNSKKILPIRGKKIYIHHGIDKDTVSVPVCDLDVVGAYPQFLETKKVYVDENVRYTGMPRFDNLPLVHKKTKKVLFMPTFRKWLVYLSDDDFLNSVYYLRIQELLNDEKLEEILKKYNYEFIFYPHIEMQNRLNLFTTKFDNIKLASFHDYDVQKLLIDSDILITDFSSVFFDFAYMKKPIIYYQFDQSEYREKHYHEGWFKYEKDGFGKVIKRSKMLIKELDNILKNNCELPTKFFKRINYYFKYMDTKNCERVFKEIENVLTGECYEKNN